MTSEHEFRTYTVALHENTLNEDLYELKVTRDSTVDRVLELMENDGWNLVNLAADSGWAVITFSRKRR